MKFREKYSYLLGTKSKEEISESIYRGYESAAFSFETRRYFVEVYLYEDNLVMIHIWDIENDCPRTKSNVERFIADSITKWSSVESAIKESQLRLQEQYEMMEVI